MNHLFFCVLSRTRKHSWHIFRRYFLCIPSVHQNCKWEHTTSQSWNALALPIWQCSWSGKGWKCLNGFGTWTCYHKTVKHIIVYSSLQSMSSFLSVLASHKLRVNPLPANPNSGCRFSTEGAPEKRILLLKTVQSVDQRPNPMSLQEGLHIRSWEARKVAWCGLKCDGLFWLYWSACHGLIEICTWQQFNRGPVDAAASLDFPRWWTFAWALWLARAISRRSAAKSSHQIWFYFSSRYVGCNISEWLITI
jgi:hypothetical protein